MIPVFLLDVQPHHRILDMCASPGSKTKHVLEIMHSKLKAVSTVMVITLHRGQGPWNWVGRMGIYPPKYLRNISKVTKKT